MSELHGLFHINILTLSQSVDTSTWRMDCSIIESFRYDQNSKSFFANENKKKVGGEMWLNWETAPPQCEHKPHLGQTVVWN